MLNITSILQGIIALLAIIAVWTMGYWHGATREATKRDT